MPTLLLNYVYYNPAGHVAEALKFAKGFAAANPGLEVHLLLNATAPTELADPCDWIAGCTPIDTYCFLDEAAGWAALAALPQEWDYIATNDWILDDVKGRRFIPRGEASMVAFHHAAAGYFHARRGQASVDYPVAEWLHHLPGLDYAVDAHVRLALPEDAVAFAQRYAHAGPKICVLLGGSYGYAAYPAVRSWIRILRALVRALPDARLYLTGARRSLRGRTHTLGYTDAQVQSLLDRVPNIVDCYDLGLWRQLALIAQCDLFLSPHTGFGFVAQCVGTKWLTLSGGNWSEGNFHNGVPCYSVLPDNPAYPYLGKSGFDMFARRPKIPCMRPEGLERKIPEIVAGARLLLDSTFSYEASIERFKENWARANVRQDMAPHGPRF